jgi:hypothetical protein
MTPNPQTTLSGPAIDYGRAMCLPAAQKAAPWDQLTPSEQTCVTEVGRTFEEKVEARLGYQGGDPPAPPEHRETAPIYGPTGQPVGQVEFNRGVVHVCWQTPPAGTQPGCDFVGYGFDSFVSAQLLLESLGFRTG